MSRLRAFLSYFLLLACSASFAQAPSGHDGVGSADVFLAKYQSFRVDRARSGEADVLKVRLGHVKGLSRSFTGAAGEFSVDLRSGKYVATLRGLDAAQTYSLWIVDRPEPARGFAPHSADGHAVRLATITASSTAVLSGALAGLPAGFSIDRVNVLGGSLPGGAVISSGAPNVFQKLFYRRLDLRRANGALALAQSTEAPPQFASLLPDVAAETLAAEAGPAVGALLPAEATAADSEPMPELGPAEASANAVPLDNLIKQGADLFFDGTFAGNGRTCGTCHPKNNNFTIDVPFIASLPPNDPLFVAENVPALAQLEKPALMRQFGLILENLDGLDDPVNKFVMRSVPHTLGMQVSLAQDTNLTNPPEEMTGWSGDGAPGAGSLRDFATGAVTQHFTKSLARIEGTDFNLPSEHQLDAMEAFQLSLGRSADFNLTTLVFTDANVEAGKLIFRDGTGDPAAGGRCGGCHGNGGALTGGLNRNFNTNAEDAVNPARAVLGFPIDGGFGLTANADGSFGNRTFNTPPLVEAADTAPFFHNNIADTLQEVIDFYTSDVFNGPRAATARFAFSPTQATQVINFLRALNALQNIQVARRELQEILGLNGNPQPQIQTRLETAAFDTADAIRVLNEGSIYPGTIAGLTAAQQNIAQARQTNNPMQRNSLIQNAVNQLSAANTAIAP
jgi:cytochrome c peroxidase